MKVFVVTHGMDAEGGRINEGTLFFGGDTIETRSYNGKEWVALQYRPGVSAKFWIPVDCIEQGPSRSTNAAFEAMRISRQDPEHVWEPGEWLSEKAKVDDLGAYEHAASTNEDRLPGTPTVRISTTGEDGQVREVQRKQGVSDAPAPLADLEDLFTSAVVPFGNFPRVGIAGFHELQKGDMLHLGKRRWCYTGRTEEFPKYAHFQNEFLFTQIGEECGALGTERVHSQSEVEAFLLAGFFYRSVEAQLIQEVRAEMPKIYGRTGWQYPKKDGVR